MKLTHLFSFIVLSLSSISCLAFKNQAFSLGVGYYSENFLNMTSQSETGETKMLGESNFPLNLKYDRTLSGAWFIAPQISYTLIPRTSPGKTAKVTHAHLMFAFGQNVPLSVGGLGGGVVLDWYLGPGIIQHEIKGAGGTVEMNNGTSTATFAIPGRTTIVRKITTNFGTSAAYGNSRIGFDLVIENLSSSKKRTQSFMLSYAYMFGGDGFGGMSSGGSPGRGAR